MKDFSVLKKTLKKDFSGLAVVKVALLGDTATQLLVQALRGSGFDAGLDLQIWEADFNQIERQIFDPSSELYKFQPAVIVIFLSTHKLLSKFNKEPEPDRNTFAERQLAAINDICESIRANAPAKILIFNFPEIDDAVFGNHANKIPSSFLFQIRKLNYDLMTWAPADVSLIDISTIQNLVGKNTFFQPSVYVNTEMVISIEALPRVAAKTTGTIGALVGKFKKCIILDLDNTLWGGVIGDDGLENIHIGNLGIGKAFVEFQYWIKKLKDRGIIVAVCSKNTESTAKEPFQKHPDMVLQLEDIAVFIANWDNKPDNIRAIQRVLNIGFDAMVFIDDNPFERNIVKENIPEICIPELPEDPASYLEYLYDLNLFETTSYSAEDSNRTRQYQVETQRSLAHQKFTNEDDFLRSLDMVSDVSGFNKFNIPRVAQLSQRSNQFNLRTVRYDEREIERLGHSTDHFTFAFTLEDKFGDNGLICVVVLEKNSEHTAFIETWLMSCRVLKRGMENFVLNTISDVAIANGYTRLKGEYKQTVKNEMVKDHYETLGFEKAGGFWYLDLENFKKKKCYITKKIV